LSAELLQHRLEFFLGRDDEHHARVGAQGVKARMVLADHGGGDPAHGLRNAARSEAERMALAERLLHERVPVRMQARIALHLVVDGALLDELQPALTGILDSHMEELALGLEIAEVRLEERIEHLPELLDEARDAR